MIKKLTIHELRIDVKVIFIKGASKNDSLKIAIYENYSTFWNNSSMKLHQEFFD